jgi:hypothetical protein
MPNKRKDAFLTRARSGQLEIKNFTPSTGIGKFDARYDPNAKELHIHLKVQFVWVALTKDGHSPWTAGEQTEYSNALRRIVEDTWSENYTLAADKDDWRDLYARLFVHVEPVTTGAHYTIEVKKIHPGETSGSGIDRANWKGLFSNFDIFTEEKLSRDQGALVFKSKQIEEKLASSHASYIAFPENSSTIPPAGALALNSFCTAVQGLVSKELAESEFKIYVYGKIGSRENKVRNMATGKNRAKAVADMLRQRLGFKDLVKVVDSFASESWMQADLDKILTANGVSRPDINSRSFQGVVVLVKDIDLTKLPARGINRNYCVVAHECGHMFGLPDEYFGVNCLGLQEQVDLRTVVPTIYANLAKLKTTPLASVVEQAEAFSAMLKLGNVPAPVFMDSKNVVTTSIMYAGSDVLPAHYLTFWEALLTICYPYFWPDEWKIVPNAAGQGKKSNIAWFAQ